MDRLFDYDSTIIREVYEHEVLLSFYNEADAYAFREWMEIIGEDLFLKWMKEGE